MKKDIVLAGVGGQGILSIATIIGTAAIHSDLFLKQAEVHGMSQRGGDVHSNLRIADREIASDLIPRGKADMIISIEPMEALRYLPMLHKDGWVITNSTPHINISDYPETSDIIREIEKIPNHVIIDANDLAHQVGNKRAANVVILGAAAPFLSLEYESFENAIRQIFATKGEEVIELNLKALKEGFKFANNSVK